MKIVLPHFEYESQYTEGGFKYIAGIDEVGRGPWAGPVVAGAVILNKHIDGLNDSKRLCEKKRIEMDLIIRKEAFDFAVGEASVEEIDEIGIQKATFLAFERAINGLKSVDFLLIDGLNWQECLLPNVAIIRGDGISSSIAAASIIAKVYRDNLMIKFHDEFPQYRFDKHKGYGTKIHQAALEKYGICKLHRKNYVPIKNLIK